ncbi:MAG: helix-turn-helix transcriptional regulator [Campylobacterota bacterium]|nr:helix-turn-helix transcriptional regulator [Campylobacterota bacterium]
MEVYEKINYLIKEKFLTKKDFANKFLSLEPKLRTTGEAPSIGSIYSYLTGKREIKIELIPYIAEALNVKEQELFEYNIEYSTEYNFLKSKDVREILELLQYLPNNSIKDLKLKLYEYKNLHNKSFKF